jgi:uncharacterized membrane protein (UPF0127 family)
MRLVAGSIAIAIVAMWTIVELNLSRDARRRVEIRCPKGQVLWVEVADDPAARSKGLSARSELSSDGMLFRWPDSGIRPIWMREMSCALDIVWCDDAGVILAIKERVPPCERQNDCPIHGGSVSNVRFVLEVAAAKVGSLGLRVGDRLEIRPSVFVRRDLRTFPSRASSPAADVCGLHVVTENPGDSHHGDRLDIAPRPVTGVINPRA